MLSEKFFKRTPSVEKLSDTTLERQERPEELKKERERCQAMNLAELKTEGKRLEDESSAFRTVGETGLERLLRERPEALEKMLNRYKEAEEKKEIQQKGGVKTIEEILKAGFKRPSKMANDILKKMTTSEEETECFLTRQRHGYQREGLASLSGEKYGDLWNLLKTLSVFAQMDSSLMKRYVASGFRSFVFLNERDYLNREVVQQYLEEKIKKRQEAAGIK